MWTTGVSQALHTWSIPATPVQAMCTHNHPLLHTSSQKSSCYENALSLKGICEVKLSSAR